MTELKIEEIFSRIQDAAAKNGLLPREANILRLLGEEMFSMTMTLAESTDCVFEITGNKNLFNLRLCAKARVSPKNKQDFVSVSSKKENVWAKGLIGKICSAIEDSIYEDTKCTESAGAHTQVWSLNEYMTNTPQEKQQEDWDGLERSILINTADDIIVSVGSGEIEMIVKKSFRMRQLLSIKA